MRRAGIIAVLLGAASLLLGAPAAFAAPGWSAPQLISDANEPIDFPDLAMNGRGDAVAVWYREAGDPNHPTITMRATRRTPGKGFGAPVTLGPAVQTGGSGPPTRPAVAIDRRGNALATWLMQDGEGNSRVAISYQPRGEAFGDVATISPPGGPAFDPEVAFDHRGRAVAVWDRVDSGITRVQAAVMAGRPRAFGEPQTLSPTGLNSAFPVVGLSDAGRAIVAWLARSTDPNKPNHIVQAAQRPKQGSFDPAQTISSPSLDADRVALAVSRMGKAMAAWAQIDPSTAAEAGTIGTAFAPPGGAFQSPQVVSAPPGRVAVVPAVSMDRRGRTTLLWFEKPPQAQAGTNLARAARTDGGGVFGEPQTLMTSEITLLQPTVGVARAGNAAGTWIVANPGIDPVDPLQAAVRAQGHGRFGATETLTPPGVSAGFPAMAANRRIAIVVWEFSQGTTLPTGVAANVYRRR